MIARTVAALLATMMLSACQPAARIEVRDAWAAATPPGATVGAAYMKLIARGGDTLVAATTPVAASVEMHANTQEDGMMKMRPLPTAELKPGETFELAPSSTHFMLIGLHSPLVADSRFPLTLQFRNAGEVVVEVQVTPPGEH